MRRAVTFLLLLAAAMPGAGASQDFERSDVAFPVTLADGAGTSDHTIRGTLHTPAGGCTTTVVLMLHGLSYARWGWDFPVEPDTYSTARALARAGFASVAIDELGYGESGGDEDPNGRIDGYRPTIPALADMTSQIAAQLGGSFGSVVLMGHSAGTAISELAAGTGAPIDGLIATAYTHFPSQRIAQDFFTGDIPRALQSDYEYFGGDEAGRTEYMYQADEADPAIVAEDNRLANLTPSGEVLTIASQPSKAVMARIDVPVLLVLAENDLLFPVANGEQEMLLFSGSDDASQMIVPRAGHSFMLHTNAPQTNADMAAWLRARYSTC